MKVFYRAFQLLLVVQLLFCIGLCYSIGYNHTVTYIFDGDAARNILLTLKAGLLSDLGWYAYGPFYYRFAHVLSEILPNFFIYTPGTESFLQSSASAALRIANVTLLFCFFWALATLARLPRFLIPFFMVTSASLFFIDLTALRYTFRAYPDMTLSSLLGLSFVFAIKHHLRFRERHLSKSLLLSLICWAAAFQTKVSAAFYVPGLALLWCHPKILRRSNFANALLVALVALALGYPQNFSTLEVWLNAGTEGHAHNQAISSTTISYFMGNFWDQLFWPFIGLLVTVSTVTFFTGKAVALNLQFFLGSFLGVIVPLGFFLGFPLTSPTKHYPLSLVIVTLVILTPIVHSGSLKISRVFKKAPEGLHVARPILARILCLSLTLFFIVFCRNSFLPVGLLESQEKVARCNEEIQDFLPKLYALEGRVFTTPYTPAIASPPKTVNLRTRWWHARVEGIEEDVAGVVVSSRFMSRFLNKSSQSQKYVETTYAGDKERIEQITNFARIVFEKDSFLDLSGRDWQQVGRYDSCGFQLWLPNQQTP